MKTKLISTRSVVIGVALLMFNAGPVLAGTVLLSGVTGNSCASYSGYSADSNGNLTITCGSGTEPVPTPTVAPVCAPYASANPINAGGATTLYANCSNITNTTTYAWTVNSSGFSTASSVGVNPQANTTYSVIATNNVGPSTSASVTVTVSTVNPIPQTTPTRNSPISEIKRWNWAFETINKYPFHDTKQEPVAYMEYNKLIQSNKPTSIYLPTSW
ncbi:conserved exported hypothetical protein [Candidatus Nitrotoga sp. HW29]|uniref:hypothetical protein n=1 Tax=Candidatus Nitrotoga sp. HW29 TaxID=2886963 RepID=UPI001EF1BA02|nr:hypothetical protein [Candidatus Nitrotoga sp. HW29]CAH1903897.1 conserved exported hypothetical protein [Candidatus Nitrotoga sp. HW29]